MAHPSDQAVLVWGGDGRLSGFVVGSELGARRTGALGAVAVAQLARPDAMRLGIIGSGTQAWAQLWGIAVIRSLAEVLVYTPTPEHRDALAARARSALGLDARAVGSPRAAVEDVDILVLATRSATPVVEASWVAAGTHVNTVGPKTSSAHEMPASLADRADVLVSDGPAQARACGERFFTDRPLDHLGRCLVEGVPARTARDEITIYCSTGLAGSEVLVAAALLAAASGTGDVTA